MREMPSMMNFVFGVISGFSEFLLTGMRKLSSKVQEALFQDVNVRKMVKTFYKMFFAI